MGARDILLSKILHVRYIDFFIFFFAIISASSLVVWITLWHASSKFMYCMLLFFLLIFCSDLSLNYMIYMSNYIYLSLKPHLDLSFLLRIEHAVKPPPQNMIWFYLPFIQHLFDTIIDSCYFVFPCVDAAIITSLFVICSFYDTPVCVLLCIDFSALLNSLPFLFFLFWQALVL